MRFGQDFQVLHFNTIYWQKKNEIKYKFKNRLTDYHCATVWLCCSSLEAFWISSCLTHPSFYPWGHSVQWDLSASGLSWIRCPAAAAAAATHLDLLWDRLPRSRERVRFRRGLLERLLFREVERLLDRLLERLQRNMQTIVRTLQTTTSLSALQSSPVPRARSGPPPPGSGPRTRPSALLAFFVCIMNT